MSEPIKKIDPIRKVDFRNGPIGLYMYVSETMDKFPSVDETTLKMIFPIMKRFINKNYPVFNCYYDDIMSKSIRIDSVIHRENFMIIGVTAKNA